MIINTEVNDVSTERVVPPALRLTRYAVDDPHPNTSRPDRCLTAYSRSRDSDVGALRVQQDRLDRLLIMHSRSTHEGKGIPDGIECAECALRSRRDDLRSSVLLFFE
jgi:hypothetical protein